MPYLQLFREKLSGKVHATILKGIMGGFEFPFFQRNLKELVREAMEMCLPELKESNKNRFDSYSVRNSVLSISHISTAFLEIAVCDSPLKRSVRHSFALSPTEIAPRSS